MRLYNKKSSKRIGGLGEPVVPIKTNKGRGMLSILTPPLKVVGEGKGPEEL